jgi:hypothetical protein
MQNLTSSDIYLEKLVRYSKMEDENFTLMILEGLICLLIGISSFILAKGTDIIHTTKTTRL